MVTCYVVQEWWLEPGITTLVDFVGVQLFICSCNKLLHSRTTATVIYILQKCGISWRVALTLCGLAPLSVSYRQQCRIFLGLWPALTPSLFHLGARLSHKNINGSLKLLVSCKLNNKSETSTKPLWLHIQKREMLLSEDTWSSFLNDRFQKNDQNGKKEISWWFRSNSMYSQFRNLYFYSLICWYASCILRCCLCAGFECQSLFWHSYVKLEKKI